VKILGNDHCLFHCVSSFCQVLVKLGN